MGHLYLYLTGAQPMLYLPLVLKQFVIKPMVIILIIMVGPESSMPHKSFKVIGLFVSVEKIFFKKFYHMAVVAL